MLERTRPSSGNSSSTIRLGNVPLVSIILHHLSLTRLLTASTRTYYEIHYKSPDEVGANMAEFAMKSLTTMINNNPPIQANGSLPHLGSRLTVVWPYAGALSAWILGIQFAIFAVVVRTAQVVVVKDDTHLSTARLLRPLVDDLGASGTLMSGRKISQALQGRREAAGLVYGPRPVKNSTDYDLAIGEDVLPRGRWPDRRHPDGVYR